MKNFGALKERILKNKYYHFALFVVLFFIFLGLFYLISLPIDLSKPYATISSFFLNNIGVNNTIFFNGINYGLQISKMQINILDVCTGLFELSVFLALIFANLLVNFKNKLLGALLLIILFLFFNLIRILLMVYLLSNVNIFVVDILHTIVFKLGFFLFFLYFYYIWLTISENIQKKK